MHPTTGVLTNIFVLGTVNIPLKNMSQLYMEVQISVSVAQKPLSRADVGTHTSPFDGRGLQSNEAELKCHNILIFQSAAVFV